METKTVLDPKDVTEVQDLLNAELQLREHIGADPEYYNELRRLIEARNNLRTLAEQKVRELKVSCGPFALISVSQDVNVEKLYEELGEEAFKAVGGYTERYTAFKIDKVRFLAYANSKAIPQEVLDACVKEKLSYRKVPSYELP